MAAPALYRDTSDGQVKRFATAREVELEIQDIQALADGTAVNLFTTATAAVNIATGVAADNDITIGPAGNQIIIDNTTGTPLITLDGNVQITGTEDVTGAATFSGDVNIGDTSGDALNVKATAVFEANVTLGESTTGGDVITFLGAVGTPANVAFTNAVVTTDIAFDGTAQAVTNDSANLTVSTTTSGNVEISGVDDVNVTIGTTAGDVFSVNTDLLLIDGNTGRAMINTATALPAGNTAQLTVNHDIADKPVITLQSGAVTATSLLTGSTNPSGGAGVPAGTGSLYMLNTGTLYVKTAAGDTAWAAIGTSASSTLQAAYNQVSGNTIIMSTSKPLTFSTNETGASESNFIVQTSAAAAYLVADAANDRIDLGSAGIPVRMLNDVTMAGATPLITADSAALTISTTTSGNLVFTSAAAVDIDAASGSNVTVDTAGFGQVLLTSAALINLTCSGDAGGLAIDINSTGTGEINIDTTDANAHMRVDGNNNNLTLSTLGTGNSDVVIQTASTSGTLDIDTGNWEINGTGGAGCSLVSGSGADMVITAGNGLSISSASGQDISMTASGSGAGFFLIAGSDGYNLDVGDTTNYRELFNMTNNEAAGVGATDANAQLLISTNSPVTGEGAGTAANIGSLCLETTNGQAWVKTGAVATAWTQLLTGSSVESLQTAYDTGATIVTAGSVAIDFTLTSGGYNVSTSASGEISLDDGTNTYLATTHGSSLQLGDGSTINLNLSGQVSSDITFDSTAQAVTNDSANLTVSTTTSGDLLLTSAGDIDLGATGGEVTVASGTAEIMSLLTGTNDPSSVATTANAGSLFMRDSANGELYIKQDDGSSVNWSKVATTDDAGDVVMSATVAEDVALGDLVYLTTTGTVGLADADSALKIRPVGVALEAGAVATTDIIRIALAGEVVINSAIAAASEGKYVYMDKTTTGGLVITPPNASGDTVLRIGVVTIDGAAGTAKIAISIGEPTLI